MRNHPDLLQAVSIISRFGFINRSIYNGFVASKGAWMAYHIWKRMRDHGFVRPLAYKLISDDYISLTKRGKLLAASMNLVPTRVPYISLLAHDELLMKFVLANEKASTFKEVYTEAYLKSNPKFFSRNFVGSKKFPDLYINISGSVIAVEYERTRKSAEAYRKIISSYSTFREVELVLFIVENESIKCAIEGVAKKNFYPFDRRPLAFALAKDVLGSLTSFLVTMNKEQFAFNEIANKVPKNIKNDCGILREKKDWA